MAEMRSEVPPRHAGQRQKMEGRRQRSSNENFPGKEVALQHAGMDSAGCEPSMRKEAKEESGNRSEMQYAWMKRPEESEASYEELLRRLKEPERSAGEERRKGDAMVPPGCRRLETNCKKKATTKPKVEAKDAQAKPPPVTTDAGKPQESVTEAGTTEESLTVGSGKSAMNQEMIDDNLFKQVFGGFYIPNEADKARVKAKQERIASRRMSSPYFVVFGSSNSYIPNEADRAMAKATQERMLTTKDPKEDDSNWSTEPAADPNSMAIQDDHVDKAKSALAKKTADDENEDYEWFRKDWESNCCNDCEHFNLRTMLGPMHYTHCTPGKVPFFDTETLQIFSMKLKLTDDNAGGFEFPLSVYGSVFVRDSLDSRRNTLFSLHRTQAQKLTQNDPFLVLTGPSRAIVSTDKVYFEILLRMKSAAGFSRDKPLITCVRTYRRQSGTAMCFGNIMCTLEVCCRIVEPAVQATIVSVQIVNKDELWRPSNFKHGGLVACTPLPRVTAYSGGNQKIVLIESKGRQLPQGGIGYVQLRRQVVSVEGGGALDVVVKSYKSSGAVATEGHVHFWAQNCHVSQQECIVGDALVTVTVAWSVVPEAMGDVV